MLRVRLAALNRAAPFHHNARDDRFQRLHVCGLVSLPERIGDPQRDLFAMHDQTYMSPILNHRSLLGSAQPRRYDTDAARPEISIRGPLPRIPQPRWPTLFGVASNRRVLSGSQSPPTLKESAMGNAGARNAGARNAGLIVPGKSYQMPRAQRWSLDGFFAVVAASGAILLMAGLFEPGVILIATVVTVFALDRFCNWGMPYLDERSARAEAMRLIREAAAGGDNTPAATLTELSTSDDPRIRRDVASNPTSPHAVLVQLAQDPHRSVRTAVALNESTQEWLLLDIVDAGDPVVCSAMLEHPSLDLSAHLRREILRLAAP